MSVMSGEWVWPPARGRRSPADDLRVLELWIEAAYLDAYAAWLSLDPAEKQLYPMPEKPAVG